MSIHKSILVLLFGAVVLCGCDSIMEGFGNALREHADEQAAQAAAQRNAEGNAEEGNTAEGGQDEAVREEGNEAPAAAGRPNQRNRATPTEVRDDDSEANPGPRVSQDPILSRLRNKPMRYTRHGECRMECRHINEDEVREILNHGTIAHDRTRRDGRCPTYAVEGTTSEDQRVRIVYGDCERETRLITAIDLGEDWDCECQ